MLSAPLDDPVRARSRGEEPLEDAVHVRSRGEMVEDASLPSRSRRRGTPSSLDVGAPDKLTESR